MIKAFNYCKINNRTQTVSNYKLCDYLSMPKTQFKHLETLNSFRKHESFEPFDCSYNLKYFEIKGEKELMKEYTNKINITSKTSDDYEINYDLNYHIKSERHFDDISIIEEIIKRTVEKYITTLEYSLFINYKTDVNPKINELLQSNSIFKDIICYIDRINNIKNDVYKEQIFIYGSLATSITYTLTLIIVYLINI